MASSDSDDDAPLAARGQKPAAGPSTSKAAKDTEQAAAVAKSAAIKAEPSSAVKSEAGKKATAHKAPPAKAVPAPAAVVKKENGGPPTKKAKVAEVKAESNGTASEPAKVKKEPKVKQEFDLPGQTRETPPETDPLRKFYTSLLEQKPDSEMAKKWCCMYGLLPLEDAEEYVAQQRQRKDAGKSLRSPVKSEGGRAPASKVSAPAAKSKTAGKASSSAPSKSGVKVKPEAKPKRKVEYSDDDDDDEPLVKKPKPAPKAAAAPKRAVKQDRAFVDGGLDSDSDDDVPLGQRK